MLGDIEELFDDFREACIMTADGLEKKYPLQAERMRGVGCTLAEIYAEIQDIKQSEAVK